MVNMIYKNLRSMFTGQRLLSLLLVLNIVVSCLVICFSYGLYQNYNVIVKQGEEEKKTTLSVYVYNEDLLFIEDDGEIIMVGDMSPQMIIDLIRSFSNDTKSNLKSVVGNMMAETPLSGYIHESGDDYVFDFATLGDDRYYSDDAEAAYHGVFFECKLMGDMIVDIYDEKHFTYDQYNNGEKVAVVLDVYYNENHGGSTSFRADPDMSKDVRTSTFDRLLLKDGKGIRSILIGGERFEITKILQEHEILQAAADIRVPLTAMSESARIWTTPYSGMERDALLIKFNDPVTRSQYEDIKQCLEAITGDGFHLEDIKFTDAVEIYYYKTIMLISVVIALLAAINMAILYRYILEKRSSELAIFRICGCSKSKAIFCYLIECMIINMPLFALTQLCYHKLIMPRLAGLFPNMQGAYSFKLYAAIFGIYIGASMIIMLIMIIATIVKHSLVDLKRSSKSTTKFSIMKVFEIVQLAAVLSMMILIVSAIVSRYELFTPFKPYLERKGYIVKTYNISTYPENFREVIGDAEWIMNQSGVVWDGDPLSEGAVLLNEISYSDEFVKAYAPPMLEGKWLGDIDETYEELGYIPAVVTYCDGRYNIGDVFEYDVDLDYVDGVPTRTAHEKYVIVGILKDKVKLASHQSSMDVTLRDYNDIYGVFSDSFEDFDYILTRFSDEYACTQANSLVWGIQFIFCDDMADEDYADMGLKLNVDYTATPLSEVYDNSLDYIYEQMYTLFPIAICIFILTIISTVSISAIYTKRQLRNYAIFYICGARWRTCALKSLRSGAMTCAVSAVLSALILIIGKATLLKETVISFGIWQLAVCAGVIILYLALSMIMPLSIIGSSEPREVLKEE